MQRARQLRSHAMLDILKVALHVLHVRRVHTKTWLEMALVILVRQTQFVLRHRLRAMLDSPKVVHRVLLALLEHTSRWLEMRHARHVRLVPLVPRVLSLAIPASMSVVRPAWLVPRAPINLRPATQLAPAVQVVQLVQLQPSLAMLV